MTDNLPLSRLPLLAELFKFFNSGKHLNRVADAGLWAEVEQQQDAYTTLFRALGYELRIDGRGFAWFHSDELNLNVSNQSRQLALLFMVIFDTQADAGKALSRFSDWVIDRALLTAIFEQHQELLMAENLDVDGLLGLLDTAARYGFARHAAGHWQLLPAVCRYLDHIEALAAQERDNASELEPDSDSDAGTDTDDDTEELPS